MKLSATIVTLNEERNIARAIESLRFADEVVVVDSGSSDRTREIALRLGARVIEEPWRGYAAQKNFAASCAANDWILSIDADEAVNEELESEILVLKQGEPSYKAYSMPRIAQYCGRWIRHGGWYPDRKIRLYHRGFGEWVGSHVHESVKTKETEGRLSGHLLHFTCSSIGEHARTVDKYTTLAARELAERGASIPLRRLTLDPAWTIFRTYVLRAGFLDGAQGLSIAWMAGFYTFLKYAKAREFRNADSASR
jgi:glycosyltransferase involved in cell wall biosynthesis